MSLYVDIEKKLNDFTLEASFHTELSSEITGILGASGSGKSMILKCIAGIEKPDKGRIVLNERVLFDSKENLNLKIQERKAGYLFQNYALFPNMTVRENIGICLKEEKENRKAMENYYLELFHLEEIADSYPRKLSGGQQQRTALARILASKPDILMLDEPFSALDTFLKENLQLELFRMLKEYNRETILVTHSREEIYRYCEQVYILDKGQKIVFGKTKEVFKNPEVLEAARLTGCKNIVKIERLSTREVYIPKWGEKLQFLEEIPENITYIGIRAHYLRKKEENDYINIVRCKISEIIEEPFEITIVMDNGIWWKIPKNQWKKETFNEMYMELVLTEESILFLRE